jgi:hypothetical protein
MTLDEMHAASRQAAGVAGKFDPLWMERYIAALAKFGLRLERIDPHTRPLVEPYTISLQPNEPGMPSWPQSWVVEV